MSRGAEIGQFHVEVVKIEILQYCEFYSLLLSSQSSQNAKCEFNRECAFLSRKLLVASTIVAVRSFTSQIDDYGAALKQFYFAVHPDFFEQHPAEKVISFTW